MPKRAADTQATATTGLVALLQELTRRGARSVTEARALNRKVLRISNSLGEELLLIPKSRTSGTWQGSTTDADLRKASPNTYWVFIDLQARPRVEYFIVPDGWMRRNIAEYHAAYLSRNNGRRAVTDTSTHHAIQKGRIAIWRDRWDLIGLS